MNGPEHYAEAERLLQEANCLGHSAPERAQGMLAAAQVHATLALAAAPYSSQADWVQMVRT